MILSSYHVNFWTEANFENSCAASYFCGNHELPFKRLGSVRNEYFYLLITRVDKCNEVRKYGKKEAGTGEHLTRFNNKINKHKWKAAAPHGRLPHTKHKLKSRPGPLSSSTVVTPHLTLPKLHRGTRDRWVVQVSFITNYSTGLAPFPRLSAPPHSPQ